MCVHIYYVHNIYVHIIIYAHIYYVHIIIYVHTHIYIYIYIKVWVGCSRGFPKGVAVKNLPANAGDTGDTSSIPGRFPGGGHDNPLQFLAREIP